MCPNELFKFINELNDQEFDFDNMTSIFHNKFAKSAVYS